MPSSPLPHLPSAPIATLPPLLPCHKSPPLLRPYSAGPSPARGPGSLRRRERRGGWPRGEEQEREEEGGSPCPQVGDEPRPALPFSDQEDPQVKGGFGGGGGVRGYCACQEAWA